MEKKNFSNKRGKANNNKQTSNTKEKRFNKSKFFKEAEKERRNEKQDNIPQHTAPRKEKAQLGVYQFPQVPSKTYYATLIKKSEQRYGYEVVNKGRCVKVEEFGENAWLRITASDGRVGITLRSNIKSMINNKIFK